MTVPAVLRTLLLGTLGVLGLQLLRPARSDSGGVLTLEDADVERLATALLSQRPPARVLWAGAQEADARWLWLLSPGPALPALSLPVGMPRALDVMAPPRPVAGRNAALAVTVRSVPGDTVLVRWTDPLGVTDSLQVLIGEWGWGSAGLRVRPTRAGWYGWGVATAADSVAVGAWVAPARPLRVLALGGTPDWESRFALRALDEASVRVEARFELGRVDVGPVVSADPGGGGAGDPSGYDAVLLLGNVALDAPAVDAMRAFVRDGGGVTIAPSLQSGRVAVSGAVAGLLREWGLADSLVATPSLQAGGVPTWALPAELTPLAPAPTRVPMLSLAGRVSGRVVASDAAGRPLAALRTVGRGRVAVLGLPETWRWRMEGGEVENHRAWWADWVAWAASGLRDRILVTTGDPVVVAGAPVQLRVQSLDPRIPAPSWLDLTRPDGTVERLPVAGGMRTEVSSAYDERVGVAHFMASAPGVYRLSWPGGETGLEAQIAPAGTGAADRSLAALASGSPIAPGIPIAPGPATDVRSGAEAGAGDGPPWRREGESRLPLGAGMLLALLAAGEWTLRRRGGGP